jgi:type VI protein secretion system component VasF
LTDEIVGEVNNHRGGPSALSPNWKIPDEGVKQPTGAMPRWIWITGLISVLLVILAFVIERIWLGAEVDTITRMSL